MVIKKQKRDSNPNDWSRNSRGIGNRDNADVGSINKNEFFSDLAKKGVLNNEFVDQNDEDIKILINTSNFDVNKFYGPVERKGISQTKEEIIIELKDEIKKVLDIKEKKTIGLNKIEKKLQTKKIQLQQKRSHKSSVESISKNAEKIEKNREKQTTLKNEILSCKKLLSNIDKQQIREAVLDKVQNI